MTTWFLTRQALESILTEKPGRVCYGPTKTRRLAWVASPGESPSVEPLHHPRPAQSPKGFFLPAAELLARYGREAQKSPAAVATQVVLFGVRACELRARNYLDHVLKEGQFADPAYIERRRNTIVISSDCVDCTETCCCTLVGGRPYPTEGYDANVTPLENGYVVDVLTERGEAVLGKPDGALKATSDQLAARDKVRSAMVERLREQNRRFTFKADDKTQPALPEMDDEGWQKHAADCVECGACTNICPTCHCFYLYEQVLGKQAFERIRTWDSCLLSTYHRMAGGPHMKLSPRPNLFNRLANRILHKFTYSPQQWGMMGCTGCGRCIDACLGAIDIREVVQDLGK